MLLFCTKSAIESEWGRMKVRETTSVQEHVVLANVNALDLCVCGCMYTHAITHTHTHTCIQRCDYRHCVSVIRSNVLTDSPALPLKTSPSPFLASITD